MRTLGILRTATVGVLLALALAATGLAAATRGIQVVAKDAATGQSGEVQLYSKSYAVIIGIDRYANLPPDRQLSYAVHDAQGVEEVLRKNYRFDAIHTLYDADATKEKILKLLTSDLPRAMGPEDSLFVFWAGHGNQESTAYGEIGYLIPHDGSSDAIYKNITMAEIRDTISKTLPAKHVFYVMDACYSGLLTTRSVDPKISRDLAYLREITKEPVRQVLTAGGKDQEVLDGGPKGHSVFTGRLIEVLEARGDFITANEIQAILKEKVFGDAKGRGHTQTPSFGALSGSGDYVFVPSAEYKLAERKVAQEKIAREIEQTRAEQERIAREIADAERLVRDAEKEQSAAAERKAREEQQRLEGLQRLAKIREQELGEQQRRQAEEETALRRIEEERQRRVAEARQQEEELRAEEQRRRQAIANLEEEQKVQRQAEADRLAALKRELDDKRQSALAAADVLSIDAAVAEINAQSARIEEIRGQFAAEEKRQAAGIEEQYRQKVALLDKGRDERRAAAKVHAVAAAEPPLEVPPKDEFETQGEYQARLAKAKGEEEARWLKARELREKIVRAEEESHQQALSEAKAQRDGVLAALAALIESETAEAVHPFQKRVTVLADKEYTLGAEALSLELGMYDADKEFFPVSITSKTQGVQVAVSGTLPLPKDMAREFKQHFSSGLVHPQVTLKAGDGKLNRAALADEVDGLLWEYGSGEFMTAEGRSRTEDRRREEEALRQAEEVHRQAVERRSAAARRLTEDRRLVGEFVCMEGGSFEMGDTFGDGDSDERPVHSVTVSDFCMGKTEVTQAQWQQIMGSNPSKFRGPERPVEKISWNDVQVFLDKLNRRTGKNYRLPTEAEWEYAARSGGKQEKWAGTSNESDLGRYAWYSKNSDDQTHPVGQKAPNGLGLYDMTGNVLEWCQDLKGDYPSSGQLDPRGPSTGWNRAMRSGSWSASAGRVRIAFRSRGDPALRDHYRGFRLATGL